jgi:hypothetical protein
MHFKYRFGVLSMSTRHFPELPFYSFYPEKPKESFEGLPAENFR